MEPHVSDAEGPRRARGNFTEVAEAWGFHRVGILSRFSHDTLYHSPLEVLDTFQRATQALVSSTALLCWVIPVIKGLGIKKTKILDAEDSTALQFTGV